MVLHGYARLTADIDLVVDLFVDPPIAVDELLLRAELMNIGDRRVPVASVADLIAMKRLAWLEEMLALALASGAIPKRRDEWGQTLVEQIPKAAR